jgi:deazaflavin-dependent oxidoreductase (nitroreductase family)
VVLRIVEGSVQMPGRGCCRLASKDGFTEGLLEIAKTYAVNTGTRLVNWVFRWMTKVGVGASYRFILTVPGRKSGRLYSTPVDVMDHEGSRWLVAGYGPSNWVENARAAGEVTLSRSGRAEVLGVEDASAAESVPVLRKYMREVRVTRGYFDALPDDPDDAIAAELPRHPVLRLAPKTP